MDADVEFFIAANFEKIRLLKKSDKGEVWLAASQSGEPVILKIINFVGLPYLQLKENPHPLWAKILFFAEGDSKSVVVEEFINGELLSERKNFLTETYARKILLQLCEGLKILHAQGIIHRDIKPSNLILQAGGIVRLIDFDAARIFKLGQDEDTKFLGTKGYAPPEQFGFGQTDARSDIYSLGVTFQKILGANYHGNLKKILAKCTEVDPRRRYNSVKELQRALTAPPPNKNFKFATASIISAAIIFSAYNFLTPQKEIETPAPTVQIEKVEAAPLKPAVEEKISAPATVTEKISPFSADDLKISSTADNSKILESTPQKINLENSASEFRIKPYNIFGNIKTDLYLNGKLFDQFKDENVIISKKNFKTCQFLLHIENNTNAAWDNSKLEITFKPNYGGKEVTRFQELKTLQPGEVVNLKIPVDSYEIPDIAQTAWLQIWVRGNEKFLTEKYWCVIFEFPDYKDRFDKGKEED